MCIRDSAPFLQEIVDGMQQFNLIGRMTDHPSIFRPLFCKGDALKWTVDIVEGLLKPKFSIEGTNARSVEFDTYKASIDVLEQCSYSGDFNLKFRAINFKFCSVVFELLFFIVESHFKKKLSKRAKIHNGWSKFQLLVLNPVSLILPCKKLEMN